MSVFSLAGKVAVVTGATGALGSAIAAGLTDAGARVVLVARREGPLRELAASLGSETTVAVADVLDERALGDLVEGVGRVDILVNGAGGNRAAATQVPGASFLSIDVAAIREVFDLNLMGTLLPCRVIGAGMVRQGGGAIVNVSSAAANLPLSRVAGYGAAKAAVENLTRYLAVDFGRASGGTVRVNAVAPGFFLGEQNRSLLMAPDGTLTERGRTIVERTPTGRFGRAEELVGTVVWLCSEAASFVTGAVIPVDGGFSASWGI